MTAIQPTLRHPAAGAAGAPQDTLPDAFRCEQQQREALTTVVAELRSIDRRARRTGIADGASFSEALRVRLLRSEETRLHKALAAARGRLAALRRAVA